ncbi:Rne/Rng family ribonuclease [Paenibacillus sp. GXUN7292]|uniref:Rne/Rng family ribonuclease n=1 Tax=Paenibacillus sp. GXUN7292 TaxID=3422499 RepID=UPI003D7E5B68
MRQMLMHANGQMLQTVVLKDGQLQEFYMERSGESGLAGNVYLGRVVNVLPGMQAAFVDIGLSKNAFLYIDDLLHPHLDKQPEQKPSIQSVVHAGQLLIVQLIKEPLGTKGARVTTHINLPGRSLVYMPRADYIGVSKKIVDDQAREWLRQIGEQLREGDEGIILRTAAASESESALAADFFQLRELWRKIEVYAKEYSSPMILHSEADLMQRVVRDRLTADIDEIWIDDQARYADASALVALMTPSLADRLRLYKNKGQQSIFEYFQVDEQMNLAFGRRIPLASGGYMIWDETEALTVIDVNTGKFIGSHALEDTVFQTNMEAAELISRLLRIRDVGGIVIIDFIDMELEANKQLILSRMTEAAKEDGTKCSIVGWTKLGLMELTRKKSRESNLHRIKEACHVCGK